MTIDRLIKVQCGIGPRKELTTSGHAEAVIALDNTRHKVATQATADEERPHAEPFVIRSQLPQRNTASTGSPPCRTTCTYLAALAVRARHQISAASLSSVLHKHGLHMASIHRLIVAALEGWDCPLGMLDRCPQFGAHTVGTSASPSAPLLRVQVSSTRGTD